MRTVTVNFRGGPLDCARRAEQVPSHWQLLRLEKCMGSKVHVYSGPISTDQDTVVRFVGTESYGNLGRD